MSSFVLRRLAAAIPTLLLVSMVAFAAVRFIPGDPVLLLAGPGAAGEDLDAARRRLGLDQPLVVQYVKWAGAMVRGDWGRSIVTGEPAARLVLARFRNTVILALTGLTLAALVGISAGVLAGYRRGGFIDLATMAGATAGSAMPAFWLGLLLVVVFAIKLRWLPVGGMAIPAAVVLPSVTIGLEATAVIARFTRSTMIDVLSADYIRTARAKGLAESVVLRRHALRNGMIPVATALGLQLGYLLGGAVFTESVFVWPGLGRLLVDAIQQRDYPLVQVGALLVASTFVLINVFVDVLYGFLDPRVRYD